MEYPVEVAIKIGEVVRRARDLADYVRPNHGKHITEVKLIEAIEALDKSGCGLFPTRGSDKP